MNIGNKHTHCTICDVPFSEPFSEGIRHELISHVCEPCAVSFPDPGESQRELRGIAEGIAAWKRGAYAFDAETMLERIAEQAQRTLRGVRRG